MWHFTFALRLYPTMEKPTQRCNGEDGVTLKIALVMLAWQWLGTIWSFNNALQMFLGFSIKLLGQIF